MARKGARRRTATIFEAFGYISGWHALYESVNTASGMLENAAEAAIVVTQRGAA